MPFSFKTLSEGWLQGNGRTHAQYVQSHGFDSQHQKSGTKPPNQQDLSTGIKTIHKFLKNQVKQVSTDYPLNFET
jgi:hypothetical protein